MNVAHALPVLVLSLPQLVGQSASIYECQAKVRQAADEQHAKALLSNMVDLDPAKMTLKQLRTLFEERGRLSTTRASNERIVSFLLGPLRGVEYASAHCGDLGVTPNTKIFSAAITVTFISATDDISEDAKPIALAVEPPFAGSLRGFKLRDTDRVIVARGKRAGYQNVDDGLTKTVQLDKDWQVRWLLDNNPSHRQFLELRALRRPIATAH